MCLLTLLGLTVREFVNWPRIGSAGDGDLPNHIIVAAHGEDPSLIEATLGHLRKLAPEVPITVLTTNSAPPISSQVTNTYQVALPTVDPSKGALINAFVASGTLGDGTVCIYDADSRPTSVRHNRLDHPVVSQQLSIYTLPPRQGRGNWLSGFWSGCATNQTGWALGYERRAFGSQCFYLIGHGLTLDSAYLGDTPFAEGVPGEDILLGYTTAINGIRVAISPGLDVAEAPDDLPEFIRQSGRWFMGEWCSLRAVTAPGSHRWVRLRLLGERHAALTFWLVGPPIIVVVGVIAVLSRARWGLLTLFLVRVGRWSATERLESRYRRTSGHCLARLVGFNVKPLLASVGAVWGIVRFGLTDRVHSMPKARS
jgi:cellulose synthase/poly-beta-1,6-N-acetylglucosamine synthase-like glycosyltransferase